jgi:drug/metabolite transporter (DMT)-like permease
VSTTNQRNLYRIVIGALMIVSGIIGAVFEPGGSIISMILITGGCAFLAVGVFRHRRYGEGPESDERSKKIGAYGLSYAWLTGILFISALYWLDLMGFLRLGTQGALGISLTVLVISAVAYQMYLFRKGDVE